MPFASRISDCTAHGGIVLTGSPNVLIGPLPAARVSDAHLCVLHAGGPVQSGSATVLINNRPAARVGDRLACAGSEETSVKGTIGHQRDDKFKERDVKKFGEQKPPEKTPLVSAKAEKVWAKDDGQVAKFMGDHGKVLSGEYKVNSAAELEVRSLHDFKARLSTEAEAKGSVVSLGGEAKGSIGTVKGSVELLTAEAKTKAGLTFDAAKGEGDLGVDAGVGVAVAKASVEGESAGWKIPFTDWEIGVFGKVEGSLLGAEAKFHAGVSYNAKDGFRAGAGGKITAFLAGLGLHGGIFVRPRKKPTPPDVLITGLLTVIIGDGGVLTKKQRLAQRQALIDAARARAAEPWLGPEERDRLLAAADRLERNNRIVERARLAEHVYTQGTSNRPPPPAGWTEVTDPAELRALGVEPESLLDADSGFKAGIYKSQLEEPPKIVVAFAGTEPEKADLAADLRQGLGVQEDQYDAAMELTQSVAANAPEGYVVETTGHSLGGGLASAGSAVTGVHGTTLNAAGLHPNTTAAMNLSPADRALHENNVDAVYNTSDPLNTLQDNREACIAAVEKITGLRNTPVVGEALADKAIERLSEGLGMSPSELRPLLEDPDRLQNALPPAYGRRIPVAPADAYKHDWTDLISWSPLDQAAKMALDGHGIGPMIAAIEQEKQSDLGALGAPP